MHIDDTPASTSKRQFYVIHTYYMVFLIHHKNQVGYKQK